MEYDHKIPQTPVDFGIPPPLYRFTWSHYPCPPCQTRQVQEGALSCIDSIVVDGDADETTKVYSSWLTPSGKTADVCKKAMAELKLGVDINV